MGRNESNQRVLGVVVIHSTGLSFSTTIPIGNGCPPPFIFQSGLCKSLCGRLTLPSEMRLFRARFTAFAVGKYLATSGSRRTRFVTLSKRSAYLPRIPLLKSYSFFIAYFARIGRVPVASLVAHWLCVQSISILARSFSAPGDIIIFFFFRSFTIFGSKFLTMSR